MVQRTSTEPLNLVAIHGLGGGLHSPSESLCSPSASSLFVCFFSSSFLWHTVLTRGVWVGR